MNNPLIDKEFYKQIHESELKRKSEIDNSVGFPTTLLALLIAGAFYLFESNNFQTLKEENFCIFILVIVLVVFFAITMLLTSGFLMKMYINIFKKYQYLPSPENLKKRELELYEHFLKYYKTTSTKYPKKKAVKVAKKEFQKDLKNYYIDFASRNQELNDARIKDFYSSRKCLILSTIILALIGFLLII